MTVPGVLEQRAVEFVGYHDLDGRPGFKLAMQRRGDRWYLYLGHLWHRGWSIVDVTDPRSPRLCRFVEGPAHTWTIQVQVADGRMVTALEKPNEGWGVDPGLPFEEGAYIWDVGTDPEDPRLLGHWRTGGTGTHRNFYAGGDLVWMTANPEGFAGHLLAVVDIADPTRPTEIGRWWWPGQHVAGGEVPEHDFYLHGPAYVVDGRAYLGYGRVGMVILDVADPTAPALVGRVSFGDLGSVLGCHSAVPVGRGLVVANSETILEGTGDPVNYACVVDVADERPRIISTFPLPRPEPGTPSASYYAKGGRFGPHNQHHPQGHPDLAAPGNRVVMTWFNAGLRVFDISDPYVPEEVGWFVPEDPRERRGTLPTTLVTQFEDVLVDARGYAYCTDKNHGLFVLRPEGGAAPGDGSA
ncbi:hypothetical protein OF117_05785 [Geodermatophilus sp. YIM 151500]|uniref:LVIVD repeat-containing protein n=1 Tax=Geodermatophilus sp. YIM 151500 TaxID=2984531 RepID=UPI0021E35FFA|nr:hypothetical protein [Geodermatophilus sp. YIM 151500]MCV2488867.1 hypothetical protein [Geodermatophilus sp. YIM 151500]